MQADTLCNQIQSDHISEHTTQDFWDTENDYYANDELYGAEWNDNLNGACGDDTLIQTEDSVDELYGTEENDILDGTCGDDTLFCRCGNDTLLGTREDSFFCQKMKKTVFLPTIHVSEDSPNLINLPDVTIPTEVFALVIEYRQLALLSELSEEEAERMGEILELAEEDDLLSSLLIEVDRSVFIQQDMLDEGNVVLLYSRLLSYAVLC
ncbi:MAG: calcium-binding protein [Symploca sp. SIO1B1]|nr:calcium-binding protein [Symploca sp. SIO1A3]NER95897.1 calcium-binding protein [Symploca sp. SIO1B1]